MDSTLTCRPVTVSSAASALLLRVSVQAAITQKAPLRTLAFPLQKWRNACHDLGYERAWNGGQTGARLGFGSLLERDRVLPERAEEALAEYDALFVPRHGSVVSATTLSPPGSTACHDEIDGPSGVGHQARDPTGPSFARWSGTGPAAPSEPRLLQKGGRRGG